MAETVEECLARAAACRAAAASEALDSVRRVHLKAATSWEILGERARWATPPRDLSTRAHSGVESDGVKFCLDPQSDGFQAHAAARQVEVTHELQDADDNSETQIPPCERASLVSAEDGILEFRLDRDPAIGETQETCTVVLYAADGHLRKLRQIEADLIRLAIQLYGGRMVEVARRLGIGRSTLYRKMSASGMIQPDDACGPDAAVEPDPRLGADQFR
jgi:hypothetical protein